MLSALLSPSRKKKPPAQPRRRRSYYKDDVPDRSDSDSYSGSDSERRLRSRRDRLGEKGRRGNREDEIRPSKSRRRSGSQDRQRVTSSSYPSSASSGHSKRKPEMGDTTPSRKTSGTRPTPPLLSESRSSLPYPGFSKAHSREAVEAKDGQPAGQSPHTPDPTDVGRSTSSKETKPLRSSWNGGAAPPSPPLTAADSHLRRAQSGSSLRRAEEGTKSPGSKDASSKYQPPSPTKNLRFAASQSSLSNLRQAEEGKSSANTSQLLQGTKPADGPQSPNRSPTRKSSANLRIRAAHQGSQTTASETTTKAADRAVDGNKSLLATQSTTQHGSRSPSPLKQVETNGNTSRAQTPFIEVFNSTGTQSDAGDSFADPPPPPPPPPLDAATGVAAKVDYLLQHGGLSQQVPKSFSSAHKPPPPQIYQQWTTPQIRNAENIDVQAAFGPYHTLLSKYEDVISRQGSIAAATGYKSVSRRMLEKVEQAIGRNVSSELCSCAVCESDRSINKDKAVSWGDVLELVSGRAELPQWPPFIMPTTSMGLGLSNLEQEAPMQKLDVDVPEEYRDHYIRQSKKTKHSVDKWLASQPEDGATPPTEVDDSTLSFAMLTYLPPSQRRTFTALIRGLPNILEPRSPTPLSAVPEENELMEKVATSLQRLYRLPSLPREPECAMFLLNNPGLHGALATLASISDTEWELLISGRFDGMLVSGTQNGTASTTQNPSRGPTPYQQASPSKGPTSLRNIFSRATPPTPLHGSIPAPNGTNLEAAPPVQADEETEIAVLAEVEREIFLGMEALENGLEALHVQAERVRAALMDRAAWLNRQAQSRRIGGEELRAVLGTPLDSDDLGWHGSPGTPVSRRMSGLAGGDAEDAFDDTESLAPDDSASNVGWRERSKYQRHRRRRPRRTPAPVEEED